MPSTESSTIFHKHYRFQVPFFYSKLDYIAKYKKAVALMKALPSDDPRSFYQQANVHCAYCDAAYNQVGYPNLDLQIHNSWLFFPWHRWYIYFHERILGSLINDTTFALPFWNYDAPRGMQLPSIYADPKSPLYDILRNPNHQPPKLIDLDYNLMEDPNASVSANLAIMYRQVVSNGKTPTLFFGSAYRAGDKPDPGAGSVENVPHGAVHIWTCDINQPNIEDMGNFYSAARDPIFFAHHSNIDRIWSIWKTLGGKRRDITDSDWLESGLSSTMRIRTLFVLTPRKGRSKKEKEEEEEVLVIEGIEFDGVLPVKFDVLIDNEDDKVIKPDTAHFAGSFVSVPHSPKHKNKKINTYLRKALTDMLENLGADDDDSVVVTLVPRYFKGKVKIRGIKIELIDD
ncbi:putative catechol oxidase [Lupinus albus]|uniref:Putative catechol oxidase n=1 Tax=Lupinus albus TaxID=3870 RepID=A0A6A4NQJ9_LUPAL|nr:putative catechol oxidase [Lupinus albus]